LAAELRWILLGLSLVLLAGIWWWGARRSRQAPGNDELRRSMGSPGSDELRRPGPPGYTAAATDEQPALSEGRHEPAREPRAVDTDSRDWGVPPFEPLRIRTGDFEPVQIVDLPMMADSDVLVGDVTLNGDPVERQAPVSPAVPPASVSRPAAASPAPDNDGRFTAVQPQTPNDSETQRIITIRVCAQGASWPGTRLMTALENHGLGYGRYKVFHRKHSDGRTLFCAASLLEPGTFDIALMPEEEFRGLSLFAVLPGPAEPLQTIDALLATAAELADTLHGAVQDSQGIALTAQRAEALREDVARFQASLTMT
jgi:cell division protein ZipA